MTIWNIILHFKSNYTLYFIIFKVKPWDFNIIPIPFMKENLYNKKKNRKYSIAWIHLNCKIFIDLNTCSICVHIL